MLAVGTAEAATNAARETQDHHSEQSEQHLGTRAHDFVAGAPRWRQGRLCYSM